MYAGYYTSIYDGFESNKHKALNIYRMALKNDYNNAGYKVGKIIEKLVKNNDYDPSEDNSGCDDIYDSDDYIDYTNKDDELLKYYSCACDTDDPKIMANYCMGENIPKGINLLQKAIDSNYKIMELILKQIEDNTRERKYRFDKKHYQ